MVKHADEKKESDGFSTTIFNREFWMHNLLIVPKVLFFSMIFAINTCYTYRTRFFRHEFGIPTNNYGILASILSLVAFASAPFWTYLADRLRKPKVILMIAAFGQAASFFLFLLIKRGTIDTLLQTMVAVVCVGSLVNFFNGALYPLLDRIVVVILSSSTHGTISKDLYGRQRLWGSLGNFIAVSLMGFLMHGDNYQVTYPAVGISFTIFLIIGYYLIPSDKIHKNKNVEDDNHKGEKESNSDAEKFSTWESMKKLFGNPRFSFFLLIVLFNGLAKAMGSHFMSNYLEEEADGLSATKGQVAIASNCGQTMEILIFLFSKDLIQRFGINTLMVVAQLSLIIRFAIHSFLPVGQNNEIYIYIAYFAEAMKGISFGCMTASGVMVAVKEAPKHLQATAQGLFSGIYIGLAPSLAGIIGYMLIPDVAPLSEDESEASILNRKLELLKSSNDRRNKVKNEKDEVLKSAEAEVK
ncbi:MFS general substrate transporter [Rozella allomycis CSF55]|uniref:MFS general substrate transporter n=1 Tax=Rozella allomycis (strain CSF55) TaxID=988480 RepID=A0A4V1IZT1_ROZAC|nr:MFS general substrate transporter [Rozella allomycis CSF55]